MTKGSREENPMQKRKHTTRKIIMRLTFTKVPVEGFARPTFSDVCRRPDASTQLVVVKS